MDPTGKSSEEFKRLLEPISQNWDQITDKVIKGWAVWTGVGLGTLATMGLVPAVGAAAGAAEGVGAAGAISVKLVNFAEKLPELGRKLDYVFGRATGSVHNVERSKEMLRQMERIGLPDTTASRTYLAEHLKHTLNNASSLLKMQENGRAVRESLLTGPQGAAKVESIWQDTKLITIKIFGGGK